MSKVYFSLSFPHDNPLRPKFSLSTNNLYGIEVKGTDIANPKLHNGNLNKGYKNRFEYAVKTQRGVTSMSLIMNTSVVLPHASWAPKAKEAKVAPPKSSDSDEDDDNNYKRSQRRLHYSDENSRSPERRRRHRNDDGSYEDEKAAVRYESRRNESGSTRQRRQYYDDESDSGYRRIQSSSRRHSHRNDRKHPKRPKGISEDRQWLAADANDGDMGVVNLD